MTGSTNTSIIALNVENLKFEMYDYRAGFTSSNAITACAINNVTENYNSTSSSIVVNGTITNGSIGSGGDATSLVAAGALAEIDSTLARFCEVIQFGALLAGADQTTLYTNQKQ